VRLVEDDEIEFSANEPRGRSELIAALIRGEDDLGPISTVSRMRWRLLIGFAQVCATTANLTLRQVFDTSEWKVPNARRLSG
jgi:hypothetical protein